jgi:hypothetical protein
LSASDEYFYFRIKGVIKGSTSQLFLVKDIIRFYVADFLDETDWDLVGWMDWQLEGYH